MVNIHGKIFVIDVGPDFRQQMLRAAVHEISAILLTHEHNDHIIGLDDVRPYNFKAWKDMPVYGTPNVLAEVRQRFDYIFKEEKYPGAPMVSLRPISKKEPINIDQMEIIPIEVQHGGMPVLGFRFGDFTYITDAKTIAPAEMEKLSGTKVLVINALQRQRHHSHLNLHEALEWIERIRPEKTYLTHLSHQIGLHAELLEELPDHIEPAFDGLQFTV